MDFRNLFIKKTKINENPNQIQEFYIEDGKEVKNPKDIINYVYLGEQKLNVELVEKINSFVKATRKTKKKAAAEFHKHKKDEITIRQLADILNKKLSIEETEDEPSPNFSGNPDENKYSIDKKIFKLYQLFNKFHNKEIANFLTKTEILKRRATELIENDSKATENDKLQAVLENVFNLSKLEKKIKAKLSDRFKKNKKKLEEQILNKPVNSQIKKYIHDKFLFYQSDINENCIKSKIEDLVGEKNNFEEKAKINKDNYNSNYKSNNKKVVAVKSEKKFDFNDSSDESDLSDFCNLKFKNISNYNNTYNNTNDNNNNSNNANKRTIDKNFSRLDSRKSFDEFGRQNLNQMEKENSNNNNNHNNRLGFKRFSSINFNHNMNRLGKKTLIMHENQTPLDAEKYINFETNLRKEAQINENSNNQTNNNKNRRLRKSMTKEIFIDDPNRLNLLDLAKAHLNSDIILSENKALEFKKSVYSNIESGISKAKLSESFGKLKDSQLKLNNSEEVFEEAEVQENESNLGKENRPTSENSNSNKVNDENNNNKKNKNIFNFNNSEDKNFINHSSKNIHKSLEQEDNSSAEKKKLFTKRGFEFKTYGVNENRLFCYLREITKNTKGKFLDYKQNISLKTMDEFHKQENLLASINHKTNEKQNFNATLINKTKNSFNSLFNLAQLSKSSKEMNFNINFNNKADHKKNITIQSNHESDTKEINFSNNKILENNKEKNNNFKLNTNSSQISNYKVFANANEKVIAGKNSRNPFLNDKHSLYDFSSEEFAENLKLHNNLTNNSKNFTKKNSSLDYQEHMENDSFLKKYKSNITLSSANKNLNFHMSLNKKESIIFQENNQNNNKNIKLKINSPKVFANSKPKNSSIKVSFDRENTLILPNISKDSGEINRKEPVSRFSQIASEKLRLNILRTKSKITTAFINNEEEETLKRKRF